MASNDRLINRAVARFDNDVRSTARNLQRKVHGIISRLPVLENVKGKDIIAGISQGTASAINNAVTDTFETNSWEAKVNRLIQPIPEIRKNVQKGFTKSFGEPTEKAKDLAIFESQQTASLFRREFAVEHFRDAISSPIFTMFDNHVHRSKAQLRAAWDNQIETQIQNYTSQRVRGTYARFIRGLNEIFREGLQLQWALYAGPESPTPLSVENGYQAPRPFCECRVQNYYHRNEIEDWGDPLFSWGGMISGTNEQNIYINLGGYNCRHRLVWVATNRVPVAVRAAQASAPEGIRLNNRELC